MSQRDQPEVPESLHEESRQLEGEVPLSVAGGGMPEKSDGPAVSRYQYMSERTRRQGHKQSSPTLASRLARRIEKRHHGKRCHRQKADPVSLNRIPFGAGDGGNPELKEFLEAKLAQGLQKVSHTAEHMIRLKDNKPLRQRYYPKKPGDAEGDRRAGE
ncbi:hypothetical protein ACLKA6_016230 [Drosophila palustris]